MIFGVNRASVKRASRNKVRRKLGKDIYLLFPYCMTLLLSHAQAHMGMYALLWKYTPHRLDTRLRKCVSTCFFLQRYFYLVACKYCLVSEDCKGAAFIYQSLSLRDGGRQDGNLATHGNGPNVGSQTLVCPEASRHTLLPRRRAPLTDVSASTMVHWGFLLTQETGKQTNGVDTTHHTRCKVDASLIQQTRSSIQTSHTQSPVRIKVSASRDTHPL